MASKIEFEYDNQISNDDIIVLRTLEPRKSILNFTQEEIAVTGKWNKRFMADIGNKSPYYRAQNGDWRENDNNTASIIRISDRNVDFNIISDDIKSKTIYRGECKNLDTNWTIQISRRGLEDSLTYARRHKDNALYKIIYNVSDLIQHSILLDSVISEKNNNNKANNTVFMHKFYAVCRLNKEHYLAKISVEEFLSSNKDTLKRLYNVQDIKIELLRHAAFTDKQLALSVLNNSELSISDLFLIVKTYDKDFYLNKRPCQINEYDKNTENRRDCMELAKKYINEFCEAEYNQTADFDNTEVGILYTTLTDEEIDLQINVDLNNYQMKYYVGGELYKADKYDSIEELIENELSCLDFNELVYYIERDGDEKLIEFAESAKNTQLESITDKVIREYDAFIEEIKKESADVIIQSANEIAEKGKIKEYFENYFDEDVSLDMLYNTASAEKDLEVLRNAPHLLDDIYQVWTDMPNLSSVEDVRTAITTAIEYGKISCTKPSGKEKEEEPQIPLASQVTKRLQEELAAFNAEMVKLDPSDILSRITEISTKREIAGYDVIGDLDLDSSRLNALLTSKNILDEVYQEWLSADVEGIEDIGLAFEKCADSIMESLNRQQHKEDIADMIKERGAAETITKLCYEDESISQVDAEKLVSDIIDEYNLDEDQEYDREEIASNVESYGRDDAIEALMDEYDLSYNDAADIVDDVIDEYDIELDEYDQAAHDGDDIDYSHQR